MATQSKRAESAQKDIGTKKRSSLKSRVAKPINNFLSRRPHRSFRLTSRRDAARSMQIPGYTQFTADVTHTLWTHRSLFGLLMLIYAIVTTVFVGFASQDIYTQFSAILDESATNGGAIFQAVLLLAAGVTGGLNVQLNDVQQVYAVLIAILTWLTTVWLLRAVLSGKLPRLRDGIYNAGSPIVATIVITLWLLVQLVPAAIGVFIFNSASATGMLDSGLIAMVVSIAVALLVVLSIYWAITSIFAIVIVTLPGMYPWQAIRASGDIVTGRRLRIVLRFAWLIGIDIIVGTIVLLPIILIDRLLTSLTDFFRYVPLVPVTMALLSSLLIVWSAAYVYMLYRKVVEDDAKPA